MYSFGFIFRLYLLYLLRLASLVFVSAEEQLSPWKTTIHYEIQCTILIEDWRGRYVWEWSHVLSIPCKYNSFLLSVSSYLFSLLLSSFVYFSIFSFSTLCGSSQLMNEAKGSLSLLDRVTMSVYHRDFQLVYWNKSSLWNVWCLSWQHCYIISKIHYYMNFQW